MAQVTQQVLNDVIATKNAGKNYTTEQWLQKFPEFEGDEKLLSAAMDYYATVKSGKYKTTEELNEKFPEFFGVASQQKTTTPQQPAASQQQTVPQKPSKQEDDVEDVLAMIQQREQSPKNTARPSDVVTQSKREQPKVKLVDDANTSVSDHAQEKPMEVQRFEREEQEKERDERIEKEMHDQFATKKPESQPVNPLLQGDNGVRAAISSQKGSKVPTVGEMREMMNKTRDEYEQEVYDRRYSLNPDGTPKDSFAKDLFDNWQTGVGEIALTPYKFVEMAENFGIDAENYLRGTNFQHGTGTATRFMNKVLGGDYLRARVEYYRKEGDRYQDGKGITETMFDGAPYRGDFGTAVGKAILSTVQSAPNLVVSIYSGKKGLETLGGAFLGSTAALQKYDEIGDRTDISAVDKALSVFGAFVSECVPEIIGAKRYGQMFNQQTVGTVRKETQKEVMGAWEKFLDNDFFKSEPIAAGAELAGQTWNSFMKHFGEGATEALTDVMNLAIDIALGIKDGVTKQDVMSIADSFIVGQLSDAIPSGVHAYQQSSYKHSVKKEIENNPTLLYVAKKNNTNPDEMAEIASKRAYQEPLTEKEQKIFDAYVEGISKHDNASSNMAVLLGEAGLEPSDETVAIYTQAIKETGKTTEEVDNLLKKDSKDMTPQEVAYISKLSEKMKELAGGEETTQETPAAQPTQEEANQPVREKLSTGTKPLEFDVTLHRESREAGGKTADVAENVTVSFRSDDYSINDNGAIESGSFTLSVKGKPVYGKRKQELMDAINAKLTTEKTAKDEADAAAREEEERQKSEAYQREQELKQMQEQLNQQKAAVRQSIPMRDGRIDAAKATPEQIVFNAIFANQNGEEVTSPERQQAAVETAKDDILYLQDKKAEVEQKTGIKPSQKKADMAYYDQQIKEYYEAIQKWIGTDATEQLKAALNTEAAPVTNEAPIVDKAPVTEKDAEVIDEPKPTGKSEKKSSTSTLTTPESNKGGRAVTSNDDLSGRKGTTKNLNTQEKSEKHQNPFDENVALVQKTNKGIEFRNRSDIKEGEVEIDKRTVYAKEGNKYVPYVIRSAKDKFGANSAVPVVGEDGRAKSIYANQLFIDEKGTPFVGSDFTGKRPSKLKVSSVRDVVNYPAYTDKNGKQYTLEDLLTPHGNMSGYEFVLQQVDAENPGDAAEIDKFNENVREVINRWNALAETLLDSKGYDADKLRAYRYLLYKNARSNAFRDGLYEAAHKYDRMIDGTVTFNVGSGFDAKHLKGKGLNNPLNRIAAMIEITKGMPEVSEIGFEVELPSDISEALSKKIVTAKEIEAARDRYKKLLATEKSVQSDSDAESRLLEEKDRLEREFPEVKTMWVPLAREEGEEGLKKVKEYYKQESGENKRLRKMSKEQEELRAFDDLCQRAVDAFKKGDMETFNQLDNEISEKVNEHKDDKVNKFANRKVAYQNVINTAINTAFPEVAKIAKLHKRVEETEAIPAKRQRKVEVLEDRLSHINAELDGINATLVPDERNDVRKAQIEETKERLEEQLEKAKEDLARPLANNLDKLRAELNEAIARNPQAEQQYQEMMKQEFPEDGLHIEFQTDGENAPMEAKSAKARLAFNSLVYVLKRVRGLNLHLVGGQEMARIWLENHGTEEDIEFIKNSKGTIYGWAVGNEVYLTDEGMNPETPIHEFAHIWMKALKINDEAAHKRVIRSLKRNKAIWDKVAKEKRFEGKSEDAIASEVIARYSSKKEGNRLVSEAAELMGDNPNSPSSTLTLALVKRMRNILNEFWNSVKNFLGIKNADDISDWIMRDLYDGKPINLNAVRAKLTEEEESIKNKAIADRTYMLAPNGNPTHLSEKQWLQVRTKAFKEWFGDWENDPKNASKIVDENGEPLVVYHGTKVSGFSHFMTNLDFTIDSGIYSTRIEEIAGVYAGQAAEDIREAELEEGFEDMSPEELIKRLSDHKQFGGVYPLFLNMRNPKIVNCSDEEGNPSRWDRLPSENGNFSVVIEGYPTQYFDTESDAANFLYEMGFDPESDDADIYPSYTTTDQQVDKAREEGYDGVIFENVLDGTENDMLAAGGSEFYGTGMTAYAGFEPNQYKSATQNKGLFSLEDDRIEYDYAEKELTQLDEPEEELIRKQEDKSAETMLDPDLSDQEREGFWENVVTRIADQSNGMRLMLNSINAYRKMKGLEPLDMDKYDVRTKFEACRSIIANKIGFLEIGEQKELDDYIRDFAKTIEDSEFYKQHMKEVGGKNPATLTPVQFIERYLMARNNWERAKEGVPRGLAEFKQRMGMGVIEFSNAFTDAYGEQAVLDLWEKIRKMTDFALDTNFEGGMISEELYNELKAKKFYVPQRGFWDDVNPENEKEENEKEDLLQRRWRGGTVARNKLDSMHKAEGGKSLAEGCLAYIARDARQAIKLSEENKVKKVMFDLLRDNADWCHEPEHGFKVPRQAYYTTNEEGKIVRMDDGPTDEQKQEMRQLQNIIKQLKEQFRNAKTDEEREAIQEEIYATEEQYPYFNEKDSYRILHSRVADQYEKGQRKEAAKEKALVGLYVNGVPCEIEMTPRFIKTADALNGRQDKRLVISGIKTITSWLSAQYTMNNPTFFAVNIVRDTPLILTKGAVEYGPEFSARFTGNFAICNRAIWQYLLTGKVEDKKTGNTWFDEKMAATNAQLLDFLNHGGNTGYSNLEELQRWRNRVADLNPGGKPMSVIEQFKDVDSLDKAVEFAGRVLSPLGKALSVAELKPVAQALNEWSEMISRFSAYKSVVDMGLGVNEGIKAAHNLSTNFNRRGLGGPFINLFNTLSVFANATIQGASGYFRTLDDQGGVGAKAKKVAKTAAVMGMLPALLGFICTMFNPDDDEYEYMVGDYTRDNYVILGDVKFALNEQLKPWWCIGVNAAQLMRGRRTMQQACNSVITSIITNWVPLPQNITAPISMAVENKFGGQQTNAGQIVRQAITPSFMQTLNQWADNKNFMGGKLRYDIGDIPEYQMAPNEAALYQDLAKMVYYWNGGNKLVPSKTKENGELMSKREDINPKEIRANMFWVPSGAMDNFCLLYGLYKDAKEIVKGEHDETNVRVKDIPIVNRFYSPSDNSLYRYAVVREARDIVTRHNNRISNLEKQAVHFSDVYNKTGDEGAKASREEAIRLLTEERKDVVAVKMKKILKKYDKYSIYALQNKLGESRKEVGKYHGESVESLDAAEKKLVQLLLEGVNLKKGLRHSTDVPEWIEWFDNHSIPRQNRREEDNE